DQVLGAAGIRRDKRQVDLGLLRGRQFFLGILRRFLQALKRLAVTAQVDALFLLVFVRDPVDDALVEVVTTQERVAVGRFHLEHAVTYVQNRDVERTTAQVVHRDCLVGLLVQPVGQRRSRRLV